MDLPSSPRTSPPIPAPIHGAGFVVGVSENPFLIDGWYERERGWPGNLPYRATAAEATFRLPLTAAARSLKLLVSAPTPLMDAPYRGRVMLGGVEMGTFTLHDEFWTIRRFALPEPVFGSDAEAIFRIVNEVRFVPARVVPGSRDYRPMGCFLAAASIENMANA